MTEFADIDAFRTAWLLISEHGERADFEAAERADALLEQGDMEGSIAWRRILRAIEELQRPRKADEAVN